MNEIVILWTDWAICFSLKNILNFPTSLYPFSDIEMNSCHFSFLLFLFFPFLSFFFLNKSEAIGTFFLDFSIFGFSPFYYLLCLNWCIIDLQYSVGFRCSTQWFDIFIHYKMNPRLNLVNTCHHAVTNCSQPCCLLHPHDYLNFIAGSSYPFIHFTCVMHAATLFSSGNCQHVLSMNLPLPCCVHLFCVFDSTYKRAVVFDLFHLALWGQSSFMLLKWQDFILKFMDE